MILSDCLMIRRMSGRGVSVTPRCSRLGRMKLKDRLVVAALLAVSLASVAWGAWGVWLRLAALF